MRSRAKRLDEFCCEDFSKVDAVLLPATPMAAPLLHDCDPNPTNGVGPDHGAISALYTAIQRSGITRVKRASRLLRAGPADLFSTA
jgi:Asp-tRNA(Asn)/Glu-tRNA(Gln) amidotransferase A subunit family amidase